MNRSLLKLSEKEQRRHVREAENFEMYRKKIPKAG